MVLNPNIARLPPVIHNRSSNENTKIDVKHQNKENVTQLRCIGSQNRIFQLNAMQKINTENHSIITTAGLRRFENYYLFSNIVWFKNCKPRFLYIILKNQCLICNVYYLAENTFTYVMPYLCTFL